MEATAKKIYAPNELVCAVAIHPGEMLKDELQARGMSQRKFAGIIGMPYTAFNEIINGKRPITTDTALKSRLRQGLPQRYGSVCRLTIICRLLGGTTSFLPFWRTYASRLRFSERSYEFTCSFELFTNTI